MAWDNADESLAKLIANRSSLPPNMRRYRPRSDKPSALSQTLQPSFRPNRRPMHRQIR
jgi:hypothetical protein